MTKTWNKVEQQLNWRTMEQKINCNAIEKDVENSGSETIILFNIIQLCALTHIWHNFNKKHKNDMQRDHISTWSSKFAWFYQKMTKSS